MRELKSRFGSCSVLSLVGEKKRFADRAIIRGHRALFLTVFPLEDRDFLDHDVVKLLVNHRATFKKKEKKVLHRADGRVNGLLFSTSFEDGCHSFVSD